MQKKKKKKKITNRLTNLCPASQKRDIGTLAKRVWPDPLCGWGEDSLTDGRKSNFAIAHPYHVGSHVASLVKFQPSDLRRDSLTEGGGVHIISIDYFFYNPGER